MQKTGIENFKDDIEASEKELLSGLADKEKKIIELILQNSEITQDRIAEIMGVSKNGIRYVMNNLKNKGILVREGAAKKGRWIINL